jgi:large subunit ribosomal protein L23
MNFGYIYDIILSPRNTEKSQNDLTKSNKYTFLVKKTATKNDIIKAMKDIFGVEVEGVNIVNTKGKTKRFKGTVGKQSDFKKAIVSIKKGQEINFSKLEDK